MLQILSTNVGFLVNFAGILNKSTKIDLGQPGGPFTILVLEPHATRADC